MYSCADTRCRVGCPIRISTDQRLLAAPNGFSQRATSFIASWCQGIHRMPLSRSRTLATRCRLVKTRHAQEPSTPKLSPRRKQNPAPQATHSANVVNASEHNAAIVGCHALTHITEPVRRMPTATRPETHQNLINPDKEHSMPPTRRTTSASRQRRTDCFSVTTGQSKRLCPSMAGQVQGRALASIHLVEVDGIEPTTPCLQSRCSTN